MAFMEGILKPCQRKVLFEREYSSEQDAMIYKCEYVMRAVAINCKSSSKMGESILELMEEILRD
jgi:hypothetical protein